MVVFSRLQCNPKENETWPAKKTLVKMNSAAKLQKPKKMALHQKQTRAASQKLTALHPKAAAANLQTF